MTNATTQELMTWLIKKGESVSSVMIHFVNGVTIAGLSNGEMEERVKKANKYFDYVEKEETKYPEHIMQYLRQREGLMKYDFTQDKKLEKMPPNQVFAEVFAWNNLKGYDKTTKCWVKEIYNIDLDKLDNVRLMNNERVELEYMYMRGFRYLVRNEIGSVKVFVNKPQRDVENNYTPYGKTKTGYDFWIETKTPISFAEQKRTDYVEYGEYEFIQWKDEPMLIADLIGKKEVQEVI